MDAVNLKLLTLLAQGLNINDIAKKTGMTRQSVYYRVKKMKEEVGLKETVTANLEKIGINTLILVMIKWRLDKTEQLGEFVPRLFAKPNVCLAFPVLGRWDYCLLVATKSMKSYRTFVAWVYKEGGEFLQEWESFPLTDFRKGGIELPDVQSIVSESD
jgi:DNA-binding Lrp family transcriptional regulator